MIYYTTLYLLTVLNIFTAKFKTSNFFKFVNVPGKILPILFLLTSKTSKDGNCIFSNF